MSATSVEVRKVHFAAFVRRALERAKTSRGWTIEQVADEAGFGAATIHRWMKGDWTKAPRADLIEVFCDALDIPTAIPLTILWPGRHGEQQVEPEPLELPVSPAIRRIEQKLADPNVSEQEKYFIAETLEQLARR